VLPHIRGRGGQGKVAFSPEGNLEGKGKVAFIRGFFPQPKGRQLGVRGRGGLLEEG